MIIDDNDFNEQAIHRNGEYSASADDEEFIGDFIPSPTPLQEALADCLSSPINEEFYSKAAEILEEAVEIVLEDLLIENEELKALSTSLLLQNIFDELTQGLPMSAKEKMRDLCVNLDIDPESPFEDYEEKVKTLRKAMYPAIPKDTGMESEFYTPETPSPHISREMKIYSATLSKLAGKD